MIWVRKFNPELHHRRSIRLRNRDYSASGYYFITICCYNRECLFGEIVDHRMILNDFGQIAWDEWARSPTIRSEIELDEFIIMPNHFHGIVKIIKTSRRGDRPVAPTNIGLPVAPTNIGLPVAPTNNSIIPPPRPNGPKPKSIGAFIGGFKSSVTKQINEIRKKPHEHVWQRNYFEQVVKDAKDLNNIRRYIRLNPSKWIRDEFYT